MGPGSFPNLSCKREVSMAISVEVSELVENFLWLTEERSCAHKAQLGNKQTLIVKGGLGTGKSIVAINLLTEFIKRKLLTQYVSKNAATREVLKKCLPVALRKPTSTICSKVLAVISTPRKYLWRIAGG
jgi:hypothetical protein